jgi:hypothetical protein
MPSPKKKSTLITKTVRPTSIPTGIVGSTPPAASDGAGGAAPPTTTSGSSPATTGASLLFVGGAPVVELPSYTPVSIDLTLYRGWRPKDGQIAAGPAAVTELESSSSYAALLGSSAPPAAQVAGKLGVALGWSSLLKSTEAFLAYVKAMEAIAWKDGLTELDRLDAVFQPCASLNPAVLTALPATARLLDVPKAIAHKAVATRSRKTKAEAKANAAVAATGAGGGATTTAPSTTATPAAAAPSAGGGKS